jgi:hypothetical protein
MCATVEAAVPSRLGGNSRDEREGAATLRHFRRRCEVLRGAFGSDLRAFSIACRMDRSTSWVYTVRPLEHADIYGYQVRPFGWASCDDITHLVRTSAEMIAVPDRRYNDLR